MAATRTTQEKLLRTVYLPRMQVQFNLRSILLQRIGRNTSEYKEGQKLSLPVHYGQTGGWGWSSTGVLPPAGSQKVERHEYNFNRMYGRIEIDGPHVEGAAASYAAERRPYDFETKNLLKQMRHGLNFDLYGDGTGKLCVPATATSSTSFTVDDVRGLVDGQFVDVLDATTGATVGGVVRGEIRVTRSTKTVTLVDGSLIDYTDVNANPTNYLVYRHGSRNDAIMGLAGIVSDADPPTGALGGLPRAANPWWQAYVESGEGVPRTPSLPLLADVLSEIEQRSDGSVDLVLCGYNTWNVLANELVQSKRFKGEATKLNGWATALVFEDNVPIVRDKHCPPDRIYCLDTTSFTIYQNDEGKWMDKDGAILRAVPNRHAYEAAWFRFLTLVSHSPNSNGVITHIDTSPPS